MCSDLSYLIFQHKNNIQNNCYENTFVGPFVEKMQMFCVFYMNFFAAEGFLDGQTINQ